MGRKRIHPIQSNWLDKLHATCNQILSKEPNICRGCGFHRCICPQLDKNLNNYFNILKNKNDNNKRAV